MKLVKKDNHYHLMDKGWLYGSTDHWLIDQLNGEEETNRLKLSIPNCQAIERGYDIEVLSSEYANQFKDDDGTSDVDFMMGFLKAIELMGDKKFTEEDMGNLWDFCVYNKGTFKDPIQSLQQNEWEVEIIIDICGDKVYAVPEPRIDEKGQALLKIKINE
jgi:hypothetical protein